jgi:non-specific serine/threonine protein kinase
VQSDQIEQRSAEDGRARPTWLRPVPDTETPTLHNLPAQLTSFVGRDRDLAEVRRLLSEHRLVTLAGLGGIGKTRLSLEVAARLLDDFPDGVWLVELAPLADPRLVARAVAALFALTERPGRALEDLLAERLRRLRLLLILDNCEHLIQASAELSDRLLRACPEVRILATSRETFNILGEAIWPVAPLDLPGDEPVVSDAAPTGAMRLFVDRSRARKPDFALTPENHASVAEICRRLDGIPLAIEMAAAWLPMLTIHELAARLDDRYLLLTGGSRVALPRHQTLRALVDWSYERLSAHEQAALRQLAVFAGGWSLAAAEEVVSSEWRVASETVSNPSLVTHYSPLATLARLVATSLITTAEARGVTRYAFLETIRQYAAERLAERTAEELAARRRHALFFTDLAERAAPLLVGREQGTWLERLDGEHDNLRAALRWSIEHDETEIALRLGGALWRFWWTRGYLDEGARWIDRALAEHGTASDEIRARALNGAGALARIGGESHRATELHTQALALLRKIDDRPGIAATFQNLASAAKDRGDFDDAGLLYEQSLALFREIGDDWGIAMALNNLGINLRGQGKFERAAALCEESLAIRRARGDVFGIGMSLAELARIARARHDHERAMPLCAESLPIFQTLGVKRHIAVGLEIAGWTAGARGQHTRAVRLYGAADALRELIGAPISPNERVDYDQGVSSSRLALGPARFAVVFAEGQTLSVEAAIDLALTTEPAAQADTLGPALSRREHEVMRLLARGLSNREIAEELVVTPLTAESHVRNVLRKLGLARRGQVAAWAAQHGFA